jgi:Right handed beta helix region/Bacterial TSP3 repeat
MGFLSASRTEHAILVRIWVPLPYPCADAARFVCDNTLVRTWWVPLLLMLLLGSVAVSAVASPQARIDLGRARIAAFPKLPRRGDPDRDGLNNWVELHRTKTNPHKYDTDGDGFSDGAEVIAGSDPLDPASVPLLKLAPFSPPQSGPSPPAPLPPGDMPEEEEEEEVECTQTLGPAGNASSAIARAAGGAVVCLEAGNYPAIELTAADKSPRVTVRSAPGAQAAVHEINLNGSSGLRFQKLRITGGVSVIPSGSDLQFIGNEITGNQGLYFFGDPRLGDRIDTVLIQGNNIHDIDYTGSQGIADGYGIKGIGDASNFTIRANTIKSPASDYIQLGGGDNWTVDRNTFLGPSLIGSHSDHQDLWQIYSSSTNVIFTNNIARNTGTAESLLFQEGTFHNVQVENNLFDHDSEGYTCQILQAQGLIFRNNTIVGSHWGCIFRDLPPPAGSSSPGSGYQIDHNIFVGTADNPDVATEGDAASWGVYDYNVSGDGSADGAQSVRNWSPSWADTVGYLPLGLPFAAGYRAP